MLLVWQRLLLLATVVGTAFYSFYLVSRPIFGDAFHKVRFPPATFDDVRALQQVFERLVATKNTSVLLICSWAYLLKQTFAIPGSALINILMGALFGQYLGFVLASVLTAIGASLCYLLSYLLGRDVVDKWERVCNLRSKVKRNKEDIFSFLLFVRLFPLTPQWFINISAPFAGVPIKQFFVATLLGMMPYNFITVTAGGLLKEVNSMNDVMQPKVIISLVLLSIGVLMLSRLKKYVKNRYKE